MRIFRATLVATIILVLAIPAMLLAQRPGGAGPSGGLFGPRTLGQPLKPGPGQIDIALKRGPSGAFLGTGRFNGPSMFATPWRPAIEPAPFYYEPVGVGLPVTQGLSVPSAEVAQPQPVAPQMTAPEAAVQGAPAQPAPGQPMPGTQFSPGGPQVGESGTAGQPAAAAGGPRYVMPQSIPVFAGGSARAAAESYAPAPAVSARLTRIARSHGIQTPSGISVSIAGGTAVLRGVVGTQHDRTLLANLAMLEPGVARVDNRLTVAPEPLASGRPER